jgi:hypothetical protein
MIANRSENRMIIRPSEFNGHGSSRMRLWEENLESCVNDFLRLQRAAKNTTKFNSQRSYSLPFAMRPEHRNIWVGYWVLALAVKISHLSMSPQGASVKLFQLGGIRWALGEEGREQMCRTKVKVTSVRFYGGACLPQICGSVLT